MTRTIIIGAVVAVVVLFVLPYLRALSVAKRHAVTLSHITGIPAEQIRREMIGRNQTPGEWAARHGLDPISFQPVGSRDLGRRSVARNANADRLSRSDGVDAGGRPTSVAVNRLRAKADTPLSSWNACPVCTNELVRAVDDVKACLVCLRAYTESGIAPLARNDGDSGVIYGTERYLPMTITEQPRAGYPKLVWMLRPSGVLATLPPVLPDSELEERAFG